MTTEQKKATPNVPIIRSQRLELRPMTPPFIEALLEDRRADAEALLNLKLTGPRPDAGDEHWLRLRLGQLRADPTWQWWLGRAVVLPEIGEMIGHAGFHEPPREGGELEFGYSIFPEHRRKGYATEVSLALMDWARSAKGISRFVLSISPDNEPSLSVARKLGFEPTGVQWDDEDGEELVFGLDYSRSSGSSSSTG
ncbi:MAG: GNAT family N-acetyltransferase [Dehalococcoidia bacterium]